MRAVYLASVWMHILAAMTWTGGMVAFVVLLMPYFRSRPDAERARFLEWFGPRFETVSWICLAVLVITGTFNLWSRGVRVPCDWRRFLEVCVDAAWKFRFGAEFFADGQEAGSRSMIKSIFAATVASTA